MTDLIPKILIVDDTPANLIALKAILKKIDAEVIKANSGNEALSLVLEHDFALFLFDVQMPEMDGYELVEILQHEDSTKNIPVVFLTAAMQDEVDRIKGYSHGAIDYIQKPLNEEILRSKVQVLLNMWQQKQELNLAFATIAEQNSQLQSEIAERNRVEKRLQHMATYDALTDLPNRILLNKEAEKAISTAERYKHRLAFLFVDLDGFKAINDDHGHKAGDNVLVESAIRLQQSIRDIDIVARFGGDEFIVLLPDCKTDENIKVIAQRIIDTLNLPLETIETNKTLGASIGISVYPSDGTLNEYLQTLADKAMYVAKNSGKNQFVFHKAEES